jgi:hypothetical protein
VSLASVGLLASRARALHGTVGVDDAQIAFVYAAHLAAGEGFVYNLGGERVEGFTSLLWVLVTSLCFLVSDAPYAAIFALTIALTAATCTLAAHLTGPRSWRWLLYLVVVLGWPAHVTWQAASLMDTALWGVLLMAATVMTLRARASTPDDLQFAGLCVALVVTRPESMLVVPGFILLRTARLARAAGEVRSPLRVALVPAAAFVTAVMALTAFRLLYFGHPLPNTYYAKVSPLLSVRLLAGVDYLAGFVRSTPVVTLLAAFVAVVLAWAVWRVVWGLGAASSRLEEMLSRDVVVLSVISAGLLCVPVLNGGDHFPWWRMYQPVFPVLAATPFVMLPGANFVRIRAFSISQVLIFASVAAAVLVRGYGAMSWPAPRELPLAVEFRLAREGLEGGELLRLMMRDQPEWPSVGVVAAGGIKRTYPGVVIDLMGLNDTRMAHAPGDRTGIKNHAAFDENVFFEHAPDIVWPFPSSGADGIEGGDRSIDDFTNTVLRGLPDNDRFLASYAKAEVCRIEEAVCIRAYYRSSFLERIGAHPALRLRLANVGRPFGD